MKRKAGKVNRIVDFLSVGEGREKGPAHKYASMLSRKDRRGEVMVLDVVAPNYEVPKNMNFIRADALKFLETSRSNSVRMVRDDLFFHFARYGKGRATMKRQDKVLNAYFSHQGALPDFRKNSLKYVRNVKRVLIPGGRFVLTTDKPTAEIVKKLVTEEGFILRTYKALNEEEIMKSGSPDTIHEFRKGEEMYRIIAIKPSLQ